MVPLVDEQKIREAAARLEELEQKGATLDYILKGPEGYVWIEEACSGDRKPRMQVSLKSCETEETPATPGARVVTWLHAPSLAACAVCSVRVFPAEFLDLVNYRYQLFERQMCRLRAAPGDPGLRWLHGVYRKLNPG